MTEVLLDTLKDAGIVIPFLFVTYLLIDWIGNRAGNKSRRLIAKAGPLGPIFGGLLGAIPQCGFSAASASLYSGRVITLGTLFAVFLSTSDEMLEILLVEQQSPLLILRIIGTKVIFGILFGFLCDFVLKMLGKQKLSPVLENEAEEVEEVCTCGCCGGTGKRGWKWMLLSSLVHTLTISLYLLLTVFILNTVVYFVGEDKLAQVLSSVPVLPQAVAALIGLIPNCAASVVITELWINGAISGGSMISGLLVGAGIGTLVLYRSNRPVKSNILIILSLWAMGFVSGLLLDLTGLSSVIF